MCMSMRSAVCVCGMGSVCARGNGRGSMSIIGVNLITKEVSQQKYLKGVYKVIKTHLHARARMCLPHIRMHPHKYPQ